MLGKNVRVNVTIPINTFDEKKCIRYNLNYGLTEIKTEKMKKNIVEAYIVGVNRPVKSFDGKVIALCNYYDCQRKVVIVAHSQQRLVDFEIKEAISFAEDESMYMLDCLYEISCGAIVVRVINNSIRYLLIKNKKSNHWGFPKGHMEKGETKKETATREVLEETGINIDIIDGFISTSEYKIAGRVEKNVSIFLASTKDTQTIIQKDEIEDYIWLSFDQAIETLRFENDKKILFKANRFINSNQNAGSVIYG